MPGMKQAQDGISLVLHQFLVICSSGPDVVSLYLIPRLGFSAYEFIQAFLEARQASFTTSCMCEEVPPDFH